MLLMLFDLLLPVSDDISMHTTHHKKLNPILCGVFFFGGGVGVNLFIYLFIFFYYIMSPYKTRIGTLLLHYAGSK